MATSKGSEFEREFCKVLSMWWSEGENDDLFWRTDCSGGRATTRAKAGKRTNGQHGDISATQAESMPLTDFFTFELKRGYPYVSCQDLLDKDKGEVEHRNWYRQASSSSKHEESFTWILLLKKDRRIPLMAMQLDKWKELINNKVIVIPEEENFPLVVAKYDIGVGEVEWVEVIYFPSTVFFQYFAMKRFKKVAKKWSKKKRKNQSSTKKSQ